ncbi:MAG: UDP-N-acetylmuramate dehydrogenase, partial [Bacteroidales bacterium]|nr:UDP-N-acetylmuramate dehydrogenase [Bacteroidales bacterium]
MHITQKVSLGAYHTFGVDVSADRMVLLRTEGETDEFLASAWARQPLLVLGSGANVLFTDEYHGTVVHLETKGIREISRNGSQVVLEVAAGECWDSFVRHCVAQGYYGVENLALIPAQVGGAVVQNIGAYGCEVKDVVLAVRAVCLSSGEERLLSREECGFGYRTSLFKRRRGEFLVRSVQFVLSLEPRFHTEYGDVAERLRQRGETTLLSVYEVISEIRREKLPDVKVLGSAGSFFRNPVVPAEKWRALQAAFPLLKGFPEEAGQVKLSAAQLIDLAGWKGYRRGDAGVHLRQPLVLVNYGRASGA